MSQFFKWGVTRGPQWYIPTGDQNDTPQSMVLKLNQQFVSSFQDLKSKYNSYYAIKPQRRPGVASTPAIKQRRPSEKLMQLGKLDLSTVYRSKFLSCIACGLRG